MGHKTHLLLVMAPLLISAVLGLDLRAQSHQATELVVEVFGVTSQVGTVQVAVFDGEEQWLSSPFRKEVVPLATQSDLPVTFLFSLPQGTYGVVAIHDRNSNGTHDVNFLGQPLEPFGFSNNISHPFSAPSWDEAMVSLSSESTTIEIQLETR